MKRNFVFGNVFGELKNVPDKEGCRYAKEKLQRTMREEDD